MSKYWYEAFITQDHNFCLIDDDGTIRATAYDLDGIVSARIRYGWGHIHRMLWKDNVITVEKKEL